MSSLKAVQADGFYRPPDGEGRGERRRRRPPGAGQTVRFEMPFPVWCEGCSHLIGKGVRFNARKEACGRHYSTTVWKFTMRAPCCQGELEVQTDPQRAEYEVVRGARRRGDGMEAAEGEGLVLDLPDEEERERRARDRMYALERGEEGRRHAQRDGERLRAVEAMRRQSHLRDYELNRRLRAAHRAQRREDRARAAEGRAMGLDERIRLGPKAPEGATLAEEAFLLEVRPRANTRAKRREIKRSSIFSQRSRPEPRGAPGGASGGASSSSKQRDKA